MACCSTARPPQRCDNPQISSSPNSQAIIDHLFAHRIAQRRHQTALHLAAGRHRVEVAHAGRGGHDLVLALLTGGVQGHGLQADRAAIGCVDVAGGQGDGGAGAASASAMTTPPF